MHLLQYSWKWSSGIQDILQRNNPRFLFFWNGSIKTHIGKPFAEVNIIWHLLRFFFFSSISPKVKSSTLDVVILLFFSNFYLSFHIFWWFLHKSVWVIFIKWMDGDKFYVLTQKSSATSLYLSLEKFHDLHFYTWQTFRKICKAFPHLLRIG